MVSTSDIDTCGVGQLGGLVMSGSRKWTSRDACVETRIYERPSTFGSNTNKYPRKTPRSKSVRVFRGKLHA